MSHMHESYVCPVSYSGLFGGTFLLTDESHRGFFLGEISALLLKHRFCDSLSNPFKMLLTHYWNTA